MMEVYHHEVRIPASVIWSLPSVALFPATSASRPVIQRESPGSPANDIGYYLPSNAGSTKIRYGPVGALFGVDAGGLSGPSHRGAQTGRTAQVHPQEWLPSQAGRSLLGILGEH